MLMLAQSVHPTKAAHTTLGRQQLEESSMRIFISVALLTFAVTGCKTPSGGQETTVKADEEDDGEDHLDRDTFNARQQLFACESAPGSSLQYVRIAQVPPQTGQQPVAPGHGGIEYWTSRTRETHGASAGLSGDCGPSPYEGNKNDLRFACFARTDTFGERPLMKIYWPAGVTSFEATPASAPVEIMEPGVLWQAKYKAVCKRLL
jgi:hypothetical protein